MDLRTDARNHLPNRPGLQALQYSRQDRATSIPNGLGRCRRMADCDAGAESPRFAFLRRGQRPHRIVKLEPQKHAVSVRPDIRIPDRTVMMFHIPPVQLQDQSPIRNKPLVLGTAVCTSTAQQTLIPTTACFDIPHANQWLWAHKLLFPLCLTRWALDAAASAR
jgi:hypothetical protein